MPGRQIVPVPELVTLGRALKKHVPDAPAYSDRPGTSNGPTNAINGRVMHQRGSALDFRNLASHSARNLHETMRTQAPPTP